MALNYIKKYLSDSDIAFITDTIAEVESNTSGELRLCLKLKRNIFERKLSPREIAVKEFYKLGMDKTVDKTGVLIFILFDERVFEIIADEGINSKIPDSKWKEISDNIKCEFSKGNYKEGLSNCIKAIGEVLSKEFPKKEGDVNELSNEVIIK